MAPSSPAQVEVDGRSLRVTNLDKVLYPATGTTKSDVIAYLQHIAPWLVPLASRRPATRKRWPNGVGTDEDPGGAFFEKNLQDRSTPDWVRTATIQHGKGPNTYPLVDDAATLVWLGQLAALELHVPQWRYAGTGDEPTERLNPDRLVLDLDPGPGSTTGQLAELAHLLREVLDGAGLVSVPVTSGSKGIHLYAALDGSLTCADASELAHELARQLERLRPDLVVSEMKKTLRQGKILLDWSQNNGNKTTVAPYSLRGRTRPTVAAPRAWDEITEDLVQLEFTDVLARLADSADPMAALAPASGAAKASTRDRLVTYRSMRDASTTPEPVPAEAPAHTDCTSFVIQRHQARRLHHDFRLERDGVLVSWALPKGPPTDSGRNHLAVQTEDHPLSYAAFEGRIPKGAYGAGVVTLWDHGTYELEKWRDGKEVIATLYGQPDGGLGGVPRTFALIATKLGGDDQNWLIHLMDGDEEHGRDTPAPVVELRPDHAAARAALERLPEGVPMLASPGIAADVRGTGWECEIKWDGYRAITRVAEGAHSLTSRSGIDLTGDYPELAEVATLLDGHQAVLDGEIVVLDRDGRSNFGLLQQHAHHPGSAHLMLFDVLHLDGVSMLNRPWQERRTALEGLLAHGAGRHVHVPETLGGDVAEALDISRTLGLEGIVAKKVDSTYRRGARAGTWRKLKHVRTQAAVVVGWSPGRSARSQPLGSVLLAVNSADGLVYIGKAGSGFDDAALAAAREFLGELERPDPPVAGVPPEDAKGVRWVEPLAVGEVSFTEWSSAGRLRHPVWRGWRPDLQMEDVVRED